MNCYFASVSQHYDSTLQNRPIAVMGKGKGTVVIAASKEAKKYGIKTGTNKIEALKLYPEIIFVEPNFAAYVHTTSIILNIFKLFTPLVEPFSIDEAFLDVTDTYEILNGKHPIELAQDIKTEMRKQLGNIITCSVGIADNKLMAKYASDLQKPDGLIYLTPDIYTEVLDQHPLSDICGIGFRINKRLEIMGIKTVQELRKTKFQLLENEFGHVTGRFLYLASRGKSYGEVDPTKYFVDPKSVSHGETFTENKSGQDLYSDIYKLCEKVSLRLRKKEMYCKSISVYIKNHKFEGDHIYIELPFHTNNTIEIFNAIVKRIPYNFVSRFICIAAINLSRYKEKDIFNENEKNTYLQYAIDKINEKFGHFTILPASIKPPEKTMENNVDIPFSGFDTDAKTGMDLTTLLRKDMDIIKHKILHN